MVSTIREIAGSGCWLLPWRYSPFCSLPKSYPIHTLKGKTKPLARFAKRHTLALVRQQEPHRWLFLFSQQDTSSRSLQRFTKSFSFTILPLGPLRPRSQKFQKCSVLIALIPRVGRPHRHISRRHHNNSKHPSLGLSVGGEFKWLFEELCFWFSASVSCSA